MSQPRCERHGGGWRARFRHVAFLIRQLIGKNGFAAIDHDHFGEVRFPSMGAGSLRNTGADFTALRWVQLTWVELSDFLTRAPLYSVNRLPSGPIAYLTPDEGLDCD